MQQHDTSVEREFATEEDTPAATPAEAAAVFARHETFHPRHGWLKKGFDAALVDHRIFVQDDAAHVLGVGKNMARAIKYWCHAFKVLEDAAIADSRAKASVPT